VGGIGEKTAEGEPKSKLRKKNADKDVSDAKTSAEGEVEQ
jgi:hypothetical protein